MEPDAVAATLGEYATPARHETLAHLSAIYERNRVLEADGFAPMLERCCPSASTCWAQAQGRRRPVRSAARGNGQDASIFWPWIGRHYKPGGICVVALNINHNSEWWAVDVEYAIARRDLDSLTAGKKKWPRGSMFAYRALANSRSRA